MYFATLIPIVLAALRASASTISVRQTNTTDDDSGITTVADNKNPVCLPFYAVRDAIMGGLFHGRCNDLARASVRLAFHDAGTFSLQRQAAGLPNGAADGSLLVDPTEVLRADNNGLQAIVAGLTPLPTQLNVSPGDVLHLAGVLGVLACPGGPVVNYLVGRTPPKNIAPEGLLPSPDDPVAKLVARFADLGFGVRETMALIGAHTAGKQRFVSLAKANSSFDSTVDIWDVRFYRETQSNTTLAGTFKLNSDVNFSRDPTTSKDFNRFVGKQDSWSEDYTKAHLKMSLLGFDQNTLTDCSEILPKSIDLNSVSVDGGDNDLTASHGGGGGGGGGNGGGGKADPVIDPVKLEAAIQKYRSIWLV